jgi:hypothetical protein
MRSSAFPTLVRQSFGRLLEDVTAEGEGESSRSLGQILGLLAVPGAFHSIYVALHYSVFKVDSYRTWIGSMDRYGFLCFSMAAMGFAAVLQWNALFPDRRDYLILTPLPLSIRRIFFAKLIALAAYICMFGLAANFFSSILFPMVSAPKASNLEFIRIVGAHVVSVMGVGLLIALILGSLQGVLMNLLSGSMFRRASEWMRIALVAFLTASLLILPFLSLAVRPLVESKSSWVYAVPPFWFLGLYEVLLPGVAHPVFHGLAAAAVNALLLALPLFFVTYLLGYRRQSRRVMEEQTSECLHPVKLRGSLSRWLLRRPVEKAAYQFIDCTMRRSAKHRICMAAYGGAIGFCLLTVCDLTVTSTTPVIRVSTDGVVSLPLILMFFGVTGLRMVFSIPSELRANWAFQMAGIDRPAAYIPAMKTWVAFRVVAPLLWIMTPVEILTNGLAVGLFHLSFAAVCGFALLEAVFVAFNKIPFTCSYSGTRLNLVGIVCVYLLGFWLFAYKLSDLESFLLVHPLRLLSFYVVSGLLLWFWRSRPWPAETKLVYEDDTDPEVRTLNLTFYT